MKRNKPARPSAIITADIHLSTHTPVSRTDDYIEAQTKKLAFLRDLQKQYQCPILDGGDLFDHWKASPWLSVFAYNNLPGMITIPGNHDLPEHSLAKYGHSALHLLGATRDDISVSFTVPAIVDGILHPEYRGEFAIYAYPYGTFDHKSASTVKKDPDYCNVLMLHEFIWPGLKPPFPNAPGYMAQALLRKLHKSFDLIISGDNHRGFVETYEDCTLINPGSMMRATADLAQYEPRCYLYYGPAKRAVPAYYPIDHEVHSTEHLDVVKGRDARIAAYIKHMNTQWEHGLSFKANLEEFFKVNKTPKLVKELIWHHLETENV